MEGHNILSLSDHFTLGIDIPFRAFQLNIDLRTRHKAWSNSAARYMCMKELGVHNNQGYPVSLQVSTEGQSWVYSQHVHISMSWLE